MVVVCIGGGGEVLLPLRIEFRRILRAWDFCSFRRGYTSRPLISRKSQNLECVFGGGGVRGIHSMLLLNYPSAPPTELNSETPLITLSH